MPHPEASAEYTSVRRAGEALGCSTRQIFSLLKDGRLQGLKQGNRRMVLLASIDSYRGEKNSEVYREVHGTLHGDLGHKGTVERIIKTLPALSQPHMAARRLGIPPQQFNSMIDRGTVPVIRLGSEQFVPAHWVASLLARAYNVPLIEQKGGAR